MSWRLQSSMAVADFHAGIDGCRFSSPSGAEVDSFSYTLAFSRLDFGFVWVSESSIASFLKVVARSGLMSVPGLRHGQPGRASSFFVPFLRSAGGDGLHS